MKKTIAILLTFCTVLCTLAIGALATEVYALTMGVHKYSANCPVSDGSDIAVVTYTRQSTGETGSVNRIYDIQPGEQFTLTAAVKEGQEAFYVFVGWLDAEGAVIGKEPTLELTMDGSKAAFAAFAENADRHILTYTVVGDGKVSVSSDRRPIEGDGCVSILHGASASIKFTPAKGCSAYYLKVDGKKVSFLRNAFDAFSDAVQDKSIKEAFNALVNIVRFFIGKEAVYTIPSVEADMTFEVGFMKPYFEKK